MKITGQREDGYHTIETIFQEISLADEIILEKTSKGTQLICSEPLLSSKNENLCLKALKTMRQAFAFREDVSIQLKKNIPIGAGLGGGSTDAAAVLVGLTKLFNLKIHPERLKECALSIGADVPFFLKGGCQVATGIGEELTTAVLPKIGAILLVFPQKEISTAWAYKNFKLKNDLSHEHVTSNFLTLIDAQASWDELGMLFENDFESLVFQTYPEIGDLKRRLIEAGAQYASLSGSGSTVFGIFEDAFMAKRAMQQFSSFQTFIAFPIPS